LGFIIPIGLSSDLKGPSMIFLIISYWIFAIPFGYFLTNYGMVNPLGAEGMWISMVLGLIIFSIFIFNRLRTVSSKYI